MHSRRCIGKGRQVRVSSHSRSTVNEVMGVSRTVPEVFRCVNHTTLSSNAMKIC